MPQWFVRKANWLKFAFPPSSSPDAGPGSLADQVSLTSDYYGGGFAVVEPDAWISSATVAKAGDNTFVTVFTQPANQIVRVLSRGIANTGAAQIIALVGTICIQNSLGTITVPLGPGQGTTLLGAGTAAGTPGMFVFNRPIVLPGEPTKIVMFFQSGDNVTYTITALACAVPRGIGFQC